MDYKGTDLGQLEFQRRGGGRGGCSCCFMFAGLMSLPLVAVIVAMAAMFIAI